MKKDIKILKSAQITIEYILFVAVVIAVLIIFLGKGGPYEKSLFSIYNVQGNSVINTGKAMFF